MKEESQIQADGAEATVGSRQGRSVRMSHPLVLAAIMALGTAFFAFTSPQAVPSVLLLVGFMVLGLMTYAALRLTMVCAGLERRLKPGVRRSILLTGTLLPMLLLMMQSIGQLTIRDVLTLGGLFLIGMFYARRMMSSH